MSIHLAIKDGKPDFSVGAFSNSLPEAAFQFLSNRIDYHMPAIEAVTSPRFGTFPTSSLRQNFDRSRNWLDPRIDKGIVSELKKRGLRFKRRGIIDTGLGVFIAFEPDNSIHGAAVPIPYVPAPWDEAV